MTNVKTAFYCFIAHSMTAICQSKQNQIEPHNNFCYSSLHLSHINTS